MSRKTNEQKREEIKLMEDRFKDVNEVTESNIIEKIDSSFDKVGSIPEGEDRNFELIRVIGEMGDVDRDMTKKTSSKYKERMLEFKKDLIDIKSKGVINYIKVN